MPPSKQWENISKDELYKLYHEQLLSLVDIGDMYNVHMEAVRRKMIKFKIPRFSNADVVGFNTTKNGFSVADGEEAIESLKELGKFKPYYVRTAKENISIPVPLRSIKNVMKGEGGKATVVLVASDLHVGHTDFLPETYLSTIETLKKVLTTLSEMYSLDKINIILNGDLVSGKDVYKGQEMDTLLSRGHWQVFLVEIMLTQLFDEISKITPVNKVVIVKGTHDSIAENYMLYLKRIMSNGKYKVLYGGKGCVFNIADPIGKYNVFFCHGKGYNEYSPVSPIMVRDLWKLFNEYKLANVPIERGCLGHTHWLSTNIELEGLTIDVTGGFQRWSRSQSQRPCGMLLYLYTDHECSVIPIRPNLEIETKEKNDPALEYKNQRFYGSMLLEHLEKLEKVDF